MMKKTSILLAILCLVKTQIVSANNPRSADHQPQEAWGYLAPDTTQLLPNNFIALGEYLEGASEAGPASSAPARAPASSAQSGTSERLTLNNLRIGQDHCASSDLLLEAIQRTGLNFLDDRGFNVFTRNNETCYSRAEQALGHQICLKNYRVERFSREYFNGPREEIRPRFSKLTVKYPRVGQLGANQPDDVSKMDEAGCNVTESSYNRRNSYGTSLRYEQCVEEIRRFGIHCRIYSDDITRERSCGSASIANDYSKLNSLRNQVSSLYSCFERFPNILTRMESESNSRDSRSGARGSTSRSTRR